ncbi:hypothetical protein D8M04_00895 [Oceanobacillus piezotolerans]|uniref:Potassium transporter n=1 Tax=Oceanobacillus piezotolerans TaxID=2448030 RepID=A0A498DF90_9BACI|nr:hypothetical protein [Oceanobacillus piezotolerans]RLL47868.1 hypothetical protein D8M04_00895 [Oceanobacillus piezotolerans]
MNNLFQENKKPFLLLLGLLFLLIIVFYFLFFQPLMKDLKSKENSLTQLDNEVAVLGIAVKKAEAKVSQDESNIEQLRLADKMPANPELEKLILTLEEIAMVSGSRFDSISFSYDGTVPERASEEETDETSNQESIEETAEPSESEEIEEQTEVINMEEKPEGLQVVNISMSVISPDYEQFLTFMKEIENQERMMTVSSMDFQQPSESELLADEAIESVVSNVNITTFYYE